MSAARRSHEAHSTPIEGRDWDAPWGERDRGGTTTRAPHLSGRENLAQGQLGAHPLSGSRSAPAAPAPGRPAIDFGRSAAAQKE